MNKKKLFLISLLSFIWLFLVWSPNAQTRTKTYYSGEAISYRGKLVFGTVNTGALELFSLENNKIVRTANFKPQFSILPKGSENYHDLAFDINGSKLLMYLIDGRYLYKYDISNPYTPILLAKLKDNAWDWFLDLEKIDNYLVSIGTKEIKYWNRDMQVVKAFRVDFDKHENVNISTSGDFIFSQIGDKLEIYNTANRSLTSNIDLLAKENSIRGVYNDSQRSEVYVVDDKALRVYNLDGRELRSFAHTSSFGYDVETSALSDTVYFSDGLGIVRNNKTDLKAIDWTYTTDIASGNGWAMDIEVVGTFSGDKLVVFNNSEILVLNNSLDLLDSFKSSDLDDAPIEKLSLRLDKNSVAQGEYLTVSGGGFGINEELSISFLNDKWSAVADSNGRFKRTINVPEPAKTSMTDIKVDGLNSGLSYSISLKVNK